MASLLKLLLLLFSIAFVFGQSSDTKTPEKVKDTKTSNKNENEAIIEKMRSDLSKLNLDSLEQYDKDRSTTKKELNRIGQRLAEFEQKQSDLNSIEEFVKLTNDAVNTLEVRIEKVENDDTSSSIDKLSNRITREIDDNKKRLDLVEESIERGNEIEEVKAELEMLAMIFEEHTQKYDESFEQIKEKFRSIDKELNQMNVNIQYVYDSTIGAAMSRFIAKGLDYLADFGELCVNITNSIIDKIKEIDYKYYYDIITDKEQQQLFKEWIIGVYNYVHFWWTQGVQPAIIKQIGDLYLNIQIATKDFIKSVHQNPLYQEMTSQAQPYVDMANIPKEYTGLIVDGILILFALSSLFVLSFFIGLCCDCCCPKRPIKKEETIEKMEKPKNTKNKKKARRSK